MWGGREKEEKVCGISSQRMMLPLSEMRKRRWRGQPALQSEAAEVHLYTEGLNIVESPGARG
jgi:Lon protease-like protein